MIRGVDDRIRGLFELLGEIRENPALRVAPTSEAFERGPSVFRGEEDEYYSENLPQHRMSQRRGSQVKLRISPRIISNIRVVPPSDPLGDRAGRNRTEVDPPMGLWNFVVPGRDQEDIR